MARNDGGQAFPIVYGVDWDGVQKGMTLRDAAALVALQGTLSNPEAMAFMTNATVGGVGPHFERLARVSWQIADEFIAAREAECLASLGQQPARACRGDGTFSCCPGGALK